MLDVFRADSSDLRSLPLGVTADWPVDIVADLLCGAVICLEASVCEHRDILEGSKSRTAIRGC